MKNKKIISIGLIVLFIMSSTITANATIDNNNIAKQNEIETKNDNSSQKYAIIMVGQYFGLWSSFAPFVNYEKIQQYYTWYLNDAGRYYEMLRDNYGYDDDNIFLLVKLLPERLFKMPTEHFNKSWVDDTCDEKILKDIFNSFKPDGKNELNENDTLSFVMINHGGVYDNGGINWTTMDGFSNNLWKNEIKSIDDKKNTAASYSKIFDNGWADEPLTLTMGEPVTIKGFRIKLGKQKTQDKIKICFYNNSELLKEAIIENWNNKYWEYLSFRNEETQDIENYTINKVEISFHENNPNFGFGRNPVKVYNFNLWPADGLNDVQKAFFGITLNTFLDLLRWQLGKNVNVLYDWELAEYVDNITAKMIFLFQPCYSGAFIDKLSGENRIICSASRGFEPADAWIGLFRQALNKEVDADYNCDGNISFAEAYEYTTKWVHNRYGNLFHPLIDDNGDRIGSYYNETSYDPSTVGMDGYLAANTFL